MNKFVADQENLTSQLRLAGLHGGLFVDFWDWSNRTVEWKPQPGAEWIAMGMTAGDITPDDLQQWISDPQKDAHIEVTVEHIPGPPLYRPPEILSALRTITWAHGKVTIMRPQLIEASRRGTSDRPTPPSIKVVPNDDVDFRPRLNYDLLQTCDNLFPAFDPSLPLTYRTGDGLVEILMRYASDDSRRVGNRLAGGLNVYAMWRTPENAKLFDEPSWTEDPDTNEKLRQQWLSPPLVPKRDLREGVARRRKRRENLFRGNGPATRRYSRQKELAYSIAEDAIRIILNDPPSHPVFDRPLVTVPVPNPRDGNAPTGPVYDVFNPGFQQFKLDLRLGMGTTSPVEEWDPSAMVNAGWGPEKDRDGRPVSGYPTSGSPQEYRFWVTSFDFFDQESEPVPVLTSDPACPVRSATLRDEYVYRPLRRAALLPPRAKSDTAQSACRLDCFFAPGR